ncbi:MAG: hypothetical protein ACLFQB_03115 [Chitinispirillaceae bacterium]
MKSNERYNDFLNFSLRRMLESAALYESQAKLCGDQPSKLFLYYLASKKRVQYVQIEKANEALRTADTESDENSYIFAELVPENTDLSKMSISEIHSLVRRKAEQEFNLFIDLASFEEDTPTKKMLINLSKMAKQFNNDIDTGYALFACRNKTIRIPTKPKNKMPILAQA